MLKQVLIFKSNMCCRDNPQHCAEIDKNPAKFAVGDVMKNDNPYQG